DPSYIPAHLDLGQALLQTGQPSKAIEELRKGNVTGDGGVLAELHRAYLANGQPAEGRAIESRLEELASHRYVSPYFRAVVAVSADDTAGAISWLEKGYSDRSWPMIFLRFDPRFDRIRTHPGFRRVLEKMNFPN